MRARTPLSLGDTRCLAAALVTDTRHKRLMSVFLMAIRRAGDMVPSVACRRGVAGTVLAVAALLMLLRAMLDGVRGVCAWEDPRAEEPTTRLRTLTCMLEAPLLSESALEARECAEAGRKWVELLAWKVMNGTERSEGHGWGL